MSHKRKRKIDRAIPVTPSASKVVNRSLLGKPQVEFSSHAVLQMKRRGIAESQVYLVIEEPTEADLKVSGPPGRKRVRRDWTGNSYLEVIYTTRPDRVIIVTAMKTARSKGKKSR